MPRRQFQGTVISNNGTKMLVVSVESFTFHPLYGKRMCRRKRYHVHAENPSVYTIGSTVPFEECRPLSKTKRWRVIFAPIASKEL